MTITLTHFIKPESVAFQHMNNLVRDDFRTLIVCADSHIGDLFIQRVTLVSQRFQHFTRRRIDL